MEENNQNKNDKTEDIRMVNDFRDELERIKQKLASDFTKYSELDKIKNKKKVNNINLNQEQIFEKAKQNEKETKNIFTKIPTMEELKIKYGLIPNKKTISETESNTSNNNKYPFMTKIDPKKLNRNEKIRDNKIINNNYASQKQKINYINSPINNQNITSIEHDEIRNKYINLDNDTNNKNLNLTFKNNNYKKLKVLKTDLNEDKNNNNFISREQRKLESPNRNNNNSINNTSLLLNSKLDQQLKLINEKSENNRLEEEKTQMKIRQIENKLQLDERLTHNNREIRKNAIKELSDMCQTDFNTDEDRQKAFDYFSPWVKYCLEETNSYVISECLNFFIIFNSLFPSFLNISMKDFFDNVERFISFGIFSINESCIKIFFMLFNDKKLYNQTFNELVKLLIKSSSASIKIIKFIQELISVLFEKNIIQENYVKILFEKVMYIYSIINIKNNEKKKIFEKLIKNIYFYIDDDYETIKKYVKLNSYKELDNLFKKINSSNMGKNMITFNLYPRPIQTEIENNHNINDLFEYNNINDRLLTEKSNSNYKSLYDRSILNKTPEKKNNNLQLCLNGEVNDIISVLPSEFFEYHLAVQFQSKMKILEKSNEILNKIKFVKDKDKNLIDVYRTINYSIEDSNILIHLEGIKLLENICRLINESINSQKLKILLETCFEKLKDKKSIIKNELFNLFNTTIENKCFEANKFISFVLHFCCNEKNDNSIIKLGLLEYIKSLFFQQNKKILRQIHAISEKEFLIFTKIIVNIIEKESLSSIKDLCSDLLIIFKRRINSQRTFYKLTEQLPNFRKKIIYEGGKVEMNENNYKKNLRQIKSSYSLSNIKKRNKNNISLNNLNNSNLDSFRNDSFSSNNNFNKISIRTSNNSKLNSNIKSNKKKDFNINISSNSSQKKIREKIIKNGNENKFINMTEIVKDNGCEKNKKNSDNLNERKNTLLKSIENINEDTIEKYSKIIIKDFLVFVKKQKNEDLSTHFELIFMIYEKIFNRIIYFMNENKNIKQNILKFKKLIDELINYLTKILILTPGIQQIKGSSKFNILIFEKYLSIFQNFCFNKEKYYMYLLLNLYKLCEGKDDDFPKNFDPKNSVIFFLKYIKKGNIELNSKKILNILKQFIAETKILSLSEKADLLEGIELYNDDEQDEKINVQDKNEEEENNIIIDKEINNGRDDTKVNKIKNNLDEKYLSNKNGDDLIDDKSNEKNLDLPLKLDEDIKLKKNDFDKIEQSIKLMSTRLKSTNLKSKDDNKEEKLIEIDKEKINKSNSNNNITNNEISKNKNKVLDNNEIKKNMNSLNIPLSILKNKFTLNNSKKLSLKLNKVNKLNLSNDTINPNRNNLLKDNNKIINNNIPTQNDKNSKTYINTINKIIKTLNNESTEEGIFNFAILQFLKLSSIEQKSEYINILQKSLENPIFLKNTSLNTLLNFYDYILSLLSLEILKFPNEESIIIKFQTLLIYLLNFRKTGDMFKVMLFLLRKYFPKDLNKKIEDISLVNIKIIAFLLKELLKNKNKEKINGKEIFCEINDLFLNTPPSTLTTLTPNCNFYQNIFTLLKSITDEIASQNKKELIDIIQYLQEKKIVCDDYIQYLIKLNATFK